MRITVDASDGRRWHDAFLAFIKHNRMEMPKALRLQARLLGVTLIKLTPPQGDDGDTPKTQGKKAVKRDINRAIQALNPQDFESPKIKKAIQDRNYQALEEIFHHFKPGDVLKDAKVVPFSKEWHTKARDSRGRVRDFEHVATPDSANVRDYVKLVQDRVGRGRGGWAKMVIDFGGTVAAWIEKHKNAGTLVDKADEVFERYIQITNESEWAQRGDDDRVMANALNSRADAIFKSIQVAQQKALEKANLQ